MAGHTTTTTAEARSSDHTTTTTADASTRGTAAGYREQATHNDDDGSDRTRCQLHHSMELRATALSQMQTRGDATVKAVLLISVLTALVELLPGKLIDDNISVPAMAALLAHLLLK